MSGSDNELLQLLKQVSENLTEDYYLRLCEAVGEVEPGYAPFEVWIGLVLVLANPSGYRVVLQAAITEPIEGELNMFRTVGWKDVANAEPVLFLEPASTVGPCRSLPPALAPVVQVSSCGLEIDV